MDDDDREREQHRDEQHELHRAGDRGAREQWRVWVQAISRIPEANRESDTRAKTKRDDSCRETQLLRRERSRLASVRFGRAPRFLHASPRQQSGGTKEVREREHDEREFDASRRLGGSFKPALDP